MDINLTAFKTTPASVSLFDADDFEKSIKPGLVDHDFSDADLTAFFERSLLYVLRQTYDTKQQELRAARFFPVSREVDPGADTFSYQGYTMYGTAKAIADYANDFPRADVYGEEKTAPLKSFGTSYGWSVQEIRRNLLAAKQTGRNPRLQERKAMAARRACDEAVNTAAFSGYPKLGIPGLLGYEGLTLVANPSGAGGDTFALKTPDEVIATFSTLFNGISVPTKGREVPNACIMPLAQYNYLRHTRLTDTGKSLLSYLAENFPEITLWDWAEELNGAGAGGADRMYMYVRNPMNLELQLPLPFTPYSAQQKGMEWVVPCEVKTGGVVVYYPQSVAYMDGI
jgi:hypothetical protein